MTMQELLPINFEKTQLQSWFQELTSIETQIREVISKASQYGITEIVREPLVDVIDEGDRVTVLIDLPGVKKENIKIRVGLNFLEISATNSNNYINGKVIRAERLSNYKLYRKIEFPYRLKISEAKALFRDGVLQVVIPKLSEYMETEVSIE